MIYENGNVALRLINKIYNIGVLPLNNQTRNIISNIQKRLHCYKIPYSIQVPVKCLKQKASMKTKGAPGLSGLDFDEGQKLMKQYTREHRY